jgi:hypothetical protein
MIMPVKNSHESTSHLTVRLHQCKRGTRKKFLCSWGVSAKNAWILALSGKGMWRLALSQTAHKAIGNEWFKEPEYHDMISRLEKLKQKRSRRVRGVRSVVLKTLRP